jgi:hypothetical protein
VEEWVQWCPIVVSFEVLALPGSRCVGLGVAGVCPGVVYANPPRAHAAGEAEACINGWVLAGNTVLHCSLHTTVHVCVSAMVLGSRGSHKLISDVVLHHFTLIVFETVTDNGACCLTCTQAVTTAPLFVWVEVLFWMRYRPQLYARVQAKVNENIADFKQSKAALLKDKGTVQ